MYVFEETINGRKLTQIINTEHENVKYLLGHKIPTTVVADPSVENTIKDADILVFVVPHAFVDNICKTIKGKVKKTAIAISLIKGFNEIPGKGIQLISHLIIEFIRYRVFGLNGR